MPLCWNYPKVCLPGGEGGGAAQVVAREGRATPRPARGVVGLAAACVRRRQTQFTSIDLPVLMTAGAGEVHAPGPPGANTSPAGQDMLDSRRQEPPGDAFSEMQNGRGVCVFLFKGRFQST